MRARPLNERLIWAGGALAIGIMLLLAREPSPEPDPALAARRAEARRIHDESVERLDADTIRWGERLFRLKVEDVSRSDDTQVALSSISWLRPRLMLDPFLAGTSNNDPVLYLRFDLLDDFPGPRTVDELALLGFVEGTQARFRIPGYRGWTSPNGPDLVVLLPERLTFPHDATCGSLQGEPGPYDWSFVRCRINVAHPADPRIEAQALIWLPGLGLPDGFPIDAIAGRARDVVLCLDVTERRDDRPEDCVDRLQGRLRAAATP